MSTSNTAEVILRGDATQLLQALDQANVKIQMFGQQGDQASQKAQNLGKNMDDAGTKTQGAAGKFNNFAQSLVGMTGGFTAVAGGILGMVEQYTSLEKAQTVAQRSADRLNQARITEQSLQNKVNQMQAAGLTGTESYRLALEKLTLQHSKVQTAEETATIAQQRANEALANFVTSIVPQALSVIGGLASAISGMPALWSKLQGSIGGAGGGLTSFVTGPVGIALIGIGALATILTLVATNAFGFRDALNAAGKAVGDALPFLRPLLDGLKLLGQQFGLTGGDAKISADQIVSDFKNMTGTTSGFAEQAVKSAQDTGTAFDNLGKHIQAKNYDAALNDLGGVIMGFFDTLTSGIAAKDDAIGTALGRLVPVFEGFGVTAGGILQAAWNRFAGILEAPLPTPDFDAAIAAVQTAFTGLIAWFGSNVITPLQQAWNSLGVIFGTFVADVIGGFNRTFSPLLGWFGSNVIGPLQQAWNTLGIIFGTFSADVIGAFSKTFSPLIGWFGSNVVSPIQSMWNSLIGIISGGIEDIQKRMGALKPAAPEAVVPPIWAPGGGIIPGPAPAPPAPPVAVARAAAAPPVPITPAAAPPAPLESRFAGVPMPIESRFAGVAIPPTPAAAFRPIPVTGEAAKSMDAYTKSANEAYNTAIKFAQVHNMQIPAAVGTSRAAVTAYINSHMDYQKELDKVSDSNAKLQQQVTATSERLTSGRAAQEDYTSGVLEQKAALQTMQEQHLKSAGSLATLESQIASGQITNAAYNTGIDEQRKKFDDAQVAIANNAGQLVEYTNQVNSGRAQNQAYTQGVQEQFKTMLDNTVAVSKATGANEEYARELATGQPQLNAYNKGVQDQRRALLDSIVALSNTAGQIDELNREQQSGVKYQVDYAQGVQSAQKALLDLNDANVTARGAIDETNKQIQAGTFQWANYQKGIIDTGKAYDDAVAKLSQLEGQLTNTTAALNRHNTAIVEGKAAFLAYIVQAQDAGTKEAVFNENMTKLANNLGFAKTGLEATTENVKLFNDAMLKGGDATGKLKDAIEKNFADIKKAGDDLLKGAGDIESKFKDFMKNIPKWAQDLLPKDMWKDIFQTGQIGNTLSKGLDLAKGVLATKGPEAAVTFVDGLRAKLEEKLSGMKPDVQAKWQPILDMLSTPPTDISQWPGWVSKVEAAIAKVNDPAQGIISTYNGIPAKLDVSGYASAGGKAADAFTNAFSANMAKMQALAPTQKGGWGLGAIGAAMGAGQQAAAGAKPTAPALPGGIDVTAATAALKGLQAEAQAIMNNIVKMAAGVGAAINTWFAKGATDAVGSLNALQANAQAIMNNLAKMPTGVAASINSNFATGAKDADGSLRGLQANAQAVMNNLAKMPVGVAASMNKNFAQAARDVDGAMRGMQSNFQGIMNNMKAAADSVARAVAAIGTAVQRLPSSKSISITITGGALGAIASIQHAVDNLHGKSISVSVGLTGPGVAFLAEGFHGFISKPTMLMVGEAGPERVDVSPLGAAAVPEPSAIRRAHGLGSGLRGGGGAGGGPGLGGNEIHIHINVGGKEVWREVRKSIFEDISQF